MTKKVIKNLEVEVFEILENNQQYFYSLIEKQQKYINKSTKLHFLNSILISLLTTVLAITYPTILMGLLAGASYGYCLYIALFLYKGV